MNNLLSYKNYNGTVEYSKEHNCLFGKVVGIKFLLSYEDNSVNELEQDFQNVIDEVFSRLQRTEFKIMLSQFH